MTTETLLRDYADLQARLCAALFARHPVEDVTKLSDLPRHGALVFDDDDWEFSQLGIGVCFTSVSTGAVVHARAWVFAYPAGFDAWRLAQYFESRGIAQISHGGRKFCATRKGWLGRLLDRLCREGLLMLVDPKCRIYMLKDDTAPDAAAR